MVVSGFVCLNGQKGKEKNGVKMMKPKQLKLQNKDYLLKV